MVSFECMAEYKGKSRGPCQVEMSDEHMKLTWQKIEGEQEKLPTVGFIKLGWKDFTHCQIGAVKPYDSTKIAFVAVYDSRPCLFKIWIERLKDVDASLEAHINEIEDKPDAHESDHGPSQVLNEKCHPVKKCLPSILHSPILLPYYRESM